MLKIEHLTITHRRDLRTILRDFSLILNRGDKAVLIGEEGNGKSTLLKWIFDPHLVEEYAEAEGIRTSQGELLGYLPQELPEEEKEKPVWEYFTDLTAFHEVSAADLRKLSVGLRLADDVFWSGQKMGSLSGGERVKLQMAGVLMARPDVLLLDEPSNDIDLETLSWLEELISGFPGAVLYISHDETLIERTANRVILIEHLRRKTLPRVTVANVPYRAFAEERRRAFDKQEQEAVSERREEKKAMERFRRIEQAVEQGQRNISRQDPHGGRLLKKKMKAVRSMERRYEREHGEMTEFPEEESAIAIRFDRQKAMPAGKTVLDISLPELVAPSGQLLARNIELIVRGPEKICIVGGNGCGKTTLIRMIAEEMCRRTDVTACYMPQSYEEALPWDITPVDFLAPSGEKEEVTTARTFLGAMKYTAEEMFHPAGELSGGQKAKLLLLKISLTEADVLILDEPTRNLSPLSGPEIRDILRGFPGAIISVSHDRKYITEVCDKIYRLTPDGLSPAGSVNI
ncbi:MAG: ABC-F family ATP-binding cassette domain-containing protein [Oscillospiraceae bacterium]|nr:ABC-F family ATP-binding cassette domain-containing protein [Oscillospiraceae bacterium]